MPSTRSTPKTTGKARGAPKKQASHKAKLAAVEEDESGDEAVDKPTASGQGLVAVATVESIERSIAEQQQELMRLRARAVLESRMAVLAEEIDALNAKKGAAPGLELVTKPLPTDKKSRKRAREESSSEESSDSSSSDEMDLGSGRSSSSDSEDRPRKKKKTGKKGKKLSAKLTLRHWRRQAKTLGGNGQAEMKVLLRILHGQQRVISQDDLKDLAFELQLLYLKHTDGPVVAERFRINSLSAAGDGQDGALDQKQVRLAQKQSVPVLASLVPKNERGAPKASRAPLQQKKAGQQAWNKYQNPNVKMPAKPSSPEVRCFKCDKVGHRALQCLQRSKGEKDGNKSA